MTVYDNSDVDELLGSSSNSSSAITPEMMMAELSSVYEFRDGLDSESTESSVMNALTTDQADLRILEDLHLPVRWANYFENAGIYTVADLVGKDRESLLSVDGIGKTAITLLEDGLTAHNLPLLDRLATMRLPSGYEASAAGDLKVIKPASEDVFISPFDGVASSIFGDSFQHTVLEALSQEQVESEAISFGDEATLSDYPSLYLSIPAVFRWLYGPTEYISTFVSLSVDYCLKDFGLHASESFFRELITILDAQTGFRDVTAEFIASVRAAIPSVLLPIKLSWISPNLNLSESGYSTVSDLVGGSASFASAYLASSLVDSLSGLLDDYRDAPINMANLIRNSLADFSGKRFSDREIDVFLKRNGIGVEPMTLEEIAGQYGLTRERIRQIEEKANKRIDFLRSKRLIPLRLAILGTAVDLGFAGAIDDINAALAEKGIIAPEEDCSGLISMFPEIEMDKYADEFSVSDYPCPVCPKASALMGKILEAQEVVFARDFFERLGCSSCEHHLSPKLAHLKPIDGLIIQDEIVGPPYDPRMKLAQRPTSVRARVLSILAFSQKAMSYDDMVEAYSEKFGEPIKKSKVMSHMGSYDEAILWGRGTYVYKDYAPFPKDLIFEIANRCKELFIANKVPLLGVGSIYELYSSRLREAEVPTEHALYSLIRLLDDSDLLLQEYPWICDSATVRGRTSFAKYFYSVLAANNGFITDEHAKQISERCMAQSFALGGLAEYSDYVINANGGWYDVEAADFDMAGIADLALELSDQMGENDIVSTVKVFDDNKERCLRYGVKSYDILYYLIDMIEDDLPIEATRKPHLVKSSHKGLSVIGAMRLYISASDHPVSKEELYEEFAIKRRLKLRGICAAILVNDEIIQVGQELLWSRSKVEIDDSFIERFDDILQSKVFRANKHANLFYSRMDVLPTFRDLPSPVGLTWNTQLLKTVISKSAHFKQFGEDANCFVHLDENPDVENTESFFYQLLENEFMGWAPFDRFADYCRSYSIEEDLKPEFFDAFSSIEADEFSIQVE